MSATDRSKSGNPEDPERQDIDYTLGADQPADPAAESGASLDGTPAQTQPFEPEATVPPADGKDRLPNTRLGRIWTATIIGLLVLVLLIIFIAQNQESVTLRYFAFEGQVNLGLALFIAAVGGGLVVAIAGVARVVQLRATARRKRKTAK